MFRHEGKVRTKYHSVTHFLAKNLFKTRNYCHGMIQNLFITRNYLTDSFKLLSNLLPLLVHHALFVRILIKCIPSNGYRQYKTTSYLNQSLFLRLPLLLLLCHLPFRRPLTRSRLQSTRLKSRNFKSKNCAETHARSVRHNRNVFLNRRRGKIHKINLLLYFISLSFSVTYSLSM